MSAWHFALTGSSALRKAGTRVSGHTAEAVAEAVAGRASTKAAGEPCRGRGQAAYAFKCVQHSKLGLDGHKAIQHDALTLHRMPRACCARAGHAVASSAGHAAAHGQAAAGAGVSLLDRALDRLLGSRLGKRVLSPQLLARIGR